MAAVDFFFDFISPYTYLARTQLGGIAARTGAVQDVADAHSQSDEDCGHTPTTVVCSNKRKCAGGHRKMVRSVSSSLEA